MRSPSGIPGLDGLIEGGFEDGTVTLVSGKTGTAKSIFCGQFLYNGILQNKQTGLYITTEDSADGIRRQFEKFGWDFAGLEKKGWLRILEFEPSDVQLLTTKMLTSVEKMKAKRIVIDSVSMLELVIHDIYEIRRGLLKVVQKIREMGNIGLLTSEVQEDSSNLSRFGVMEFMVDAVISLQYLGIAKYKRSLMVRKMRMTDHDSNIHPFEISKNGIVVRPIGKR
jgi:circadian clock protein KaiC